MESPVRILVVDDDEVYREVLRDAISEGGTHITLASDGVEALSVLSAEPIDILISDLNMPRMDGLALLRHARQAFPHVLTIIITGYGSLESAIEAIRLGAYDYVQKPFKLEEVKVTARNAIEKVKILREKARLLIEIDSLRQKLHLLETLRSIRQEGEETPALEAGAEKPFFLVAQDSLPLFFLEIPQESPGRILTALESLKDLKREGVIDEPEFRTLKKAIIEKLESGRS